MTSSILIALWGALVGHLLVLIAVMMDGLPPAVAITASAGCSLVAIAALSESERSDPRARRTIAGLRGAQGVAAVVIVAGVLPGAPGAMLLVGLASAAALCVAGLATVRRAAVSDRPSRPLAVAPRVAAIALVAEGALKQWDLSGYGESETWLASYLGCIVALRIVALEALSIIVIRVRTRWAIGGLLPWVVGWAVVTANLVAVITWLLGGAFRAGPLQIRQFDAMLVQLLITIGGAMIGGALIVAIHPRRPRLAAFALLAGYVACGVLIAIEERRLDRATDPVDITSLRSKRDVVAAVAAIALAGVLRLYWRHLAVSNLPRATAQATVAASPPSRPTDV
ncbi:MAG TPA: hypothetical protein VNO30_40410 [Kofleriaceae bacterium]|nr:hypothetical protein [Kofleriaceae bacterium]